MKLLQRRAQYAWLQTGEDSVSLEA